MGLTCRYNLSRLWYEWDALQGDDIKLYKNNNKACGFF